jgi:hypothetical protein
MSKKTFGRALRNVKAFSGGMEVPSKIRHSICPKCKKAVPNLKTPCMSCGYDPFGSDDEEEEEDQKQEKQENNTLQSNKEIANDKKALIEEEDEFDLEDKVKQKPFAHRLTGFVFWISWLLLFLGRPDVFQVKGYSASILDVMKYTQLKAIDKTGYETNVRQAFAVVAIPGEVFRLADNTFPSYRNKISNGTKEWVKKHKAKKFIPKDHFLIYVASIACTASVFVAINFPKIGSIMFTFSLFVMYESLFFVDHQLNVFLYGWLTIL